MSEAYRPRRGPGPASTVQRVLRELTERDIVEHSPRESYSVPDPVLRAWIGRMNRAET